MDRPQEPAPGSPGSQRALAAANRRRVEDVLRRQGSISQADVARSTGLAPATVSNIVRALRAEEIVERAPAEHGRRPLIRLAPSDAAVAGLDFGHRHLSAALADPSGTVLAARRTALAAATTAERSLALAGDLLEGLLGESRRDHGSLRAVGLGLPAPVSQPSGRMDSQAILPGWADVDVVDQARRQLDVPVVVDNDANLAALAEHRWGAGQDVEDLAYIKLSEGVGGGLLIDGRPFRGRGGTAGELGHTTVEENGRVCRCGNRGCLETLASARALVELLEPRLGPETTIADIVAAAAEGEHSCLRVLTDTGHHAGRALADLCNIVNPQRIIVGGELAQAGELLLAPMREAVRRHAVPSATHALDIRPAALGDRSAALGAVALALERIAAEATDSAAHS
ncbi:ROK family transcriptional regulator [Nesterenkonia halophila]|uniref:ROK family transcriptional regulator n=1 Tax=Nesterenkonia halophila TaxID=302044 RepID=UPI001291CDCC|nr:ROK family transcriptional regulator [Nesterenkonia halophila]